MSRITRVAHGLLEAETGKETEVQESAPSLAAVQGLLWRMDGLHFHEVILDAAVDGQTRELVVAGGLAGRVSVFYRDAPHAPGRALVDETQNDGDCEDYYGNVVVALPCRWSVTKQHAWTAIEYFWETGLRDPALRWDEDGA